MHIKNDESKFSHQPWPTVIENIRVDKDNVDNELMHENNRFGNRLR
jgi:hypothetical protein